MKENTIKSLSANVSKGETGIHYFNGDEMIEVTTSDSKLMTKIRKLAKDCKEVVIDQEPCKDNGGFMLALVPYACLGFHLPRTRQMTEEQKQAAAERMRKMRKAK